MSVLNPDHLIEQSVRLIASSSAGPPRQVDLRRAVSSAYYAVFHFILTAAADEFVGASKRTSKNYSLAYRSVDHRALRDLCLDIKKSTLPAKLQRHAPPNGFGPNLLAFSAAFIELQEKRHAADYDPSYQMKTSDAKLMIDTATVALRRFGRASSNRKRVFLSLLMFSPR